jgi:hypothetical protein
VWLEDAFRSSAKCRHSWLVRFRNELCDENGLCFDGGVEDGSELWEWFLRARVLILKADESGWLERVVSGGVKLSWYKMVKSNLRREVWVEGKVGVVGDMVRLRAGIAELRVETGRYDKLPRCDRICLMCDSGEIEDEEHFLMRCDGCVVERRMLWSELRRRLEGEGEFGVKCWCLLMRCGVVNRVKVLLGGVWDVSVFGQAWFSGKFEGLNKRREVLRVVAEVVSVGVSKMLGALRLKRGGVEFGDR